MGAVFCSAGSMVITNQRGNGIILDLWLLCRFVIHMRVVMYGRAIVENRVANKIRVERQELKAMRIQLGNNLIHRSRNVLFVVRVRAIEVLRGDMQPKIRTGVICDIADGTPEANSKAGGS